MAHGHQCGVGGHSIAVTHHVQDDAGAVDERRRAKEPRASQSQLRAQDGTVWRDHVVVVARHCDATHEHKYATSLHAHRNGAYNACTRQRTEARNDAAHTHRITTSTAQQRMTGVQSAHDRKRHEKGTTRTSCGCRRQLGFRTCRHRRRRRHRQRRLSLSCPCGCPSSSRRTHHLGLQ